jgi:uncharacterized protein YkwD
MALSASTPPSRSIFSSTAIASALPGSLVHRHWRCLWRPQSHFLVGQFVRSSLISIVVIAVLLGPALAAERKFRAPDQPRKESGAYPSKQDLLTIEENILLFTNNERHKRGLPLFQKSSALRYLARKQSENMCEARTLEHESDLFPKGWKKFTDRLKAAGLRSGAENIGYRTLREQPEKWAAAVVREWMKSPPHRKNILNPRWRYLGVGVFLCRNRIAYTAQFFSSEPGRIH